MNIFKKFKKGLYKSSSYLTTNIINSLKLNKISDEKIEEIESVLISADLGIGVTNQLIEKLRQSQSSQLNNHNAILELIAIEIKDILKKTEKPLFDEINSVPHVFIFVGVNGSGKQPQLESLSIN